MLLGIPLLLTACNDCSNEVLRTTAAPDGKHQAILFERGCGVGSGNNMQVSIVETGKLPEGFGNVVTLSDTARAGGTVDEAIRMTWRDRATLEVAIDSRMYVGDRRDAVGEIAVKFTALEAPATRQKR